MTTDIREFKRILDEIRWLDADLYDKDLIFTWEKNIKEIRQVLFSAEALKWLFENNISFKCFESGMSFLFKKEQQSLWDLRNNFFFILANNLLGLSTYQSEHHALDIWKLYDAPLAGVEIICCQELPRKSGESIMIEEDVVTYGKKGLQKTFSKDLNQEKSQSRKPGIINLDWTLDNPGQSMADILLLKEHFLSLERLAGKKIAVVWDNSASSICPPSIPQSFITLANRFGINLNMAYPEGCDLNPKVIDLIKQNNENDRGELKILPSIGDALDGVDAVYSMKWHTAGNKVIDNQQWMFVSEKQQLLIDNETFIMNCESSEKYKPYVLASMIVNNRFKNPSKLIGNLRKRNTSRINEF